MDFSQLNYQFTQRKLEQCPLFLIRWAYDGYFSCRFSRKIFFVLRRNSLYELDLFLQSCRYRKRSLTEREVLAAVNHFGRRNPSWEKKVWRQMSRWIQHSEDFIEKYKDKLDMSWIPFGSLLSEEFLTKHYKKELESWPFGREFPGYNAMCNIINHQKLSVPFIKKYHLDQPIQVTVNCNGFYRTISYPVGAKDKQVNKRKKIRTTNRS